MPCIRKLQILFSGPTEPQALDPVPGLSLRLCLRSPCAFPLPRPSFPISQGPLPPPFALLALRPTPDAPKNTEALLPALAALQHTHGEKLHMAQENDLFFLLLLENPGDEPQEILASLKKQSQGISLNIGIYTHPLPGFSPDQALDQARKALTHSHLLGPGATTFFDAVSLNISGDEAYQEGRIAEAIAEYEAALILDPLNANVLNSLGVCFAVLQDFDKALEAFDRSHAAAPQESMAVYNQGLLHEMQGAKEKACIFFEKALHLNPLSFESAFHLGRMHMALGKQDLALPCLEKACALRPENGPALGLLAQACLAAGDLPRAFAFFRQALRRMPRDPAVLSGLGACFDQKGENPDIAATFCEEALTLEPGRALFALRLARIRMRQGRFEEAGTLFMQAQEGGETLTEKDRLALESVLPQALDA